MLCKFSVYEKKISYVLETFFYCEQYSYNWNYDNNKKIKICHQLPFSRILSTFDVAFMLSVVGLSSYFSCLIFLIQSMKDLIFWIPVLVLTHPFFTDEHSSHMLFFFYFNRDLCSLWLYCSLNLFCESEIEIFAGEKIKLNSSQ